MGLKEFDWFLLKYFELFKVIELIIKNGKICVNELDRPKEQEKYQDIFPKSIFTLRRKLNEMVESKLLQKETTKEHEKNNAHYVYSNTGNLEELIILLHNRLSVLIKESINLKEIKYLDIKLLEDLISRGRLFETQKSAKVLETN